jgi:hypothetical protein
MKQPSPSLLQRLSEALFGEPRTRDADPADMGTAFGMECSLAADWDDEDEATDRALLGLALPQAQRMPR